MNEKRRGESLSLSRMFWLPSEMNSMNQKRKEGRNGGWVGGWVGGLVGRWIDGWIDGWIDRLVDGSMDLGSAICVQDEHA